MTRKRKSPEHDLQCAIVEYLNMTLVDALVFSIPNQRMTKLQPWTLAALTKEGMLKGIPDLCIIQNGKPYFIEVKADKGRLSEAQNAVIGRIVEVGASCSICRSIEDAQQFVLDCGLETRDKGLKVPSQND